MTYLVSTDGPPETWWSISNSLTDWFLEAALSGLDRSRPSAKLLIESAHFHGLELDRVRHDNPELFSEVISALQAGAERILERENENASTKNHMRKLLALLQDCHPNGHGA